MWQVSLIYPVQRRMIYRLVKPRYKYLCKIHLIPLGPAENLSTFMVCAEYQYQYQSITKI